MITKLAIFALLACLSVSGNAAPFRQTGATVSVAVTATAQSLTLPVSTAFARTGDAITPNLSAQVLVTNVGTQTIFLRFDGVTATVANAAPVLSNARAVFSVPPNSTAISVIGGATGSTVYLTPGVGD